MIPPALISIIISKYIFYLLESLSYQQPDQMEGPEFSNPSATVRLALRVYFTTLLLLLGIIGNECCRKRVRYRVFTRQNFSLVDMPGWLNGFDAPLAMWSFGASPAGWLGYIMIFAGLYGIASDLAVSGLVVTVNVAGRCPFNTSGPYVVEMQNTPMNLTIEPAPFGATYQMISQARLTSLQNGGLAGIYGKINGDVSFRADPTDVLGQWKCEISGADMVFPMNASLDNIYQEFYSQQLVFNESWTSCYDEHGDDINGRFLIWSTSTPQPGYQLAKPWEVGAVVDMTTDAYAAQQILRPFLCQMNAPSLDTILAQTSIDWWFSSWCEEVRGHIYTDFASAGTTTTTTDPGTVFESIMDSLLMTSGAAWNLTQFPLSQGCLVVRTKVSWVVVTIFVLVTISTVMMIIYWIALVILIHSASRQYSPQQIKDIEEYTPNGLLSWISVANNLTI